MILYHKNTDTSHWQSVSFWFYTLTRNESTIELLSSSSHSLKTICCSETAGRFWTTQAKINVCLSKDKTFFATERRGEEKSQEEWLSLEEPARLLPMMLELYFLIFTITRCNPQSFSWMHCLYQAISQECKQGYTAATLLFHNKSNNKFKWFCIKKFILKSLSCRYAWK